MSDELLPINTAREFEQWLKLHGKKAGEVWLVIYKKSSGKQTVTYDQLLEVGLCYGWIDGVRTKKPLQERDHLLAECHDSAWDFAVSSLRTSHSSGYSTR